MAYDMTYNPENIFAKIIRGEIPCDKVYEDDLTLAFKDINPQAPVHVLVIPKGQYVNIDDFHEKASDAEISALMRAIGKVAKLMDLPETGYRVLANIGEDGHQEIPHLHFHVVGKRDLGRMVGRPKGES